MLWLAACRDYALLLKNDKIVFQLNDMLFINQEKLVEQLNKKNISSIEEGEFLDFFRVIPTFADRKDFYTALLESDTKIKEKKCQLFIVSG